MICYVKGWQGLFLRKEGNRMSGIEAMSMISIFIAILTLLAMIIFGIIDIFKKK